MVAVVTVLARATGLGRWIVFSKTVGGSCLADTYNTANLMPTVMFEVVAGGALAGVVVPVLAGAVARGDRAVVDRTASALLSWALLLMIPVALAAALAARPLMRLFLGTGAACEGAVDAGTRLLLMFVPQLFCYAIAVVLAGTLQAHRRFLAAAAAPLASSLVVIGAYLSFVVFADGSRSVVPSSAEVALGLGTTLGVAALALAVVVPIRSTGLRLRPTLEFPAGVLPRVRALALAGVAVVTAQQVSLLVVAALANRRGEPGAFTAYTWAWAVYLLPYAVLAVPIATSAFPRLAAAAEDGSGSDTDTARVISATTRAVLVVSAAGAALVAGTAVPVSRVFAANGGLADADMLTGALVAFAPGLIGFGLIAHLTRVLYAAHEGRRAATAAVSGWVAVVLADVALVAATPDRNTVAALGAGQSVGMTVGGVLLLVTVARLRGPAALTGVVRTGTVASIAAVLAGGCAYAVASPWSGAGFAAGVGGAAVLAVLGGAVFAAVMAALDRDSVTQVAALARRRREIPVGSDVLR